ncbi:hypothetical protein [Tsukamurella sp. 8J]|uniref:hypothetical protein n=1 Tax=Tsukamurella sp. 8J TaxID=3031962 RepID=UPI0023BA32E3|nr:hypothetical protein [Tsukamurella sp. 8J]MDF0532641.1 hypothetical protein [Tsukamurella sp. 8J]
MNVPLPGQHHSRPVPVVDVDPAEIRASVEDVLHLVDELEEAPAEGGDLAVLGKQAALLEQAHQVLVDALDRVDRA